MLPPSKKPMMFLFPIRQIRASLSRPISSLSARPTAPSPHKRSRKRNRLQGMQRDIRRTVQQAVRDAIKNIVAEWLSREHQKQPIE